MAALIEGTPQAVGGRVEWLSPRQHETLALLAQGYSNQAIAAELVLSVRSVENYVNGIFTTLGLTGIKGRQPRVLAALGYHYLLRDLPPPVGLLVRFADAAKSLRLARSVQVTAQTEFNVASVALQDLADHQLSQAGLS